jgi:thimet oligopeptidase
MRRTFVTVLLASVASAATAAPAPTVGSAVAFAGQFDGRPQTAAMIDAKCTRWLGELTRLRTAMEADKRPASVETVVQAYDDYGVVLSGAYGDMSLYAEVITEEAANTAANTCLEKLSAESSRFSLSRPLYDRMVAVEMAKADPETRWLMARYKIQAEQAGVSLDAAGRAKVQALNEEISKAGIAFNKAIADDKTTVAATVAELDGLPQDFIDAHKPGANGKVTLKTDYTDYIPVLTYAKSAALRQRMSTAFNRRAYPANDANLKVIFNKRQELATLLGKKDYASLSLSDRMARNPETVRTFLEQLAAIDRPVGMRDYARKLAALKSLDPKVTTLNHWDNAFTDSIVQKRDYGYDSQEARKYFAYPKVRDGILKLSSDLFDVTFRKWDTPVWNSEVEAYEMLDHGKVVGRFYLDMHPRQGKYTHANAGGIRATQNGQGIPTAMLVANVPTGLLTHDDVVTFLHEFGHVLHQQFGGHTRWASTAQGGVEWDFVEAPSQMLENWVFDYDTLAGFATDENGKVIPRDLVEKMNKARYFNAGLLEMRQLSLSSISLGFHSGPAPANLGEAMRAFTAKYSLIPTPADNEMQDSFGHLNGYAAAYYTYQWSKAISDDLFTRFQKEGLRNKKTAGDYRREVLTPGGARPAAESIKAFLGRDWNVEAHKEEIEKDK